MAEIFFSAVAPANNSGVASLARMTLDGTTLHVDLVAIGLTPGQAHPIQIDGFPDGSGAARLAVASDDTNGNGIIERAEAAVATGAPLFDVTPSGTNTHGAGAGADAPVADANGVLALSQNYTLDPAQPNDAQLLSHLAGSILGIGGTTTATAFDPTLPAAQGQVLALTAADAAAAGPLANDASTFLQQAGAVVVALGAYTLKVDGSGPVLPEPAAATQPGATEFAAVLLPSNNSGAYGLSMAHLDAAAGTLQVDLWMAGLTPDQAHPAHIHGFSNNAPSLLPNASLDTDRDGFVEDAEGERVTGPVILTLTQDGSISDAVLTANSGTADASGNLQIHQTYQFDQNDPVQRQIFSELEDRLTGREVQVHGLDVTAQQGAGTVNEVNGEAGYKPGLPVANGIYLPLDGPDASVALASLAQTLETQFGGTSPQTDQMFA
ncbi:CHRD domain-containing protein [Paracraurococcus lichenis]|uniref:CHRD domain-containing protein n=1 Tax=Paracraurococcus lichenis TaxID=3064888 RepID=A0ABT9E2W2_9PROT|nr:CHRD domain-containing protein [Paracraurococcus sp. LOR1-02]MDO9710493.1 CHRD domain-containing protein [Paracraurococcus sp. LOR1-02]